MTNFNKEQYNQTNRFIKEYEACSLEELKTHLRAIYKIADEENFPVEEVNALNYLIGKKDPTEFFDLEAEFFNNVSNEVTTLKLSVSKSDVFEMLEKVERQCMDCSHIDLVRLIAARDERWFKLLKEAGLGTEPTEAFIREQSDLIGEMYVLTKYMKARFEDKLAA